eukprot:2110734-Lingulodinium_polyedra.AAC.1
MTIRFSGLPADLDLKEVRGAIEYYGKLDHAFPKVEDIPGVEGQQQLCVYAIYVDVAVAKWVIRE